jgi:hypothetical protein
MSKRHDSVKKRKRRKRWIERRKEEVKKIKQKGGKSRTS